MANIFTTYDRFIPPDRRPHYLPPLTVVSSTTSTAYTPAPTPTPITAFSSTFALFPTSGRQKKETANV